jgi:hypothetical protein
VRAVQSPDALDLRSELLRQPDVLAKDVAQSLRTKMPKNHPKL